MRASDSTPTITKMKAMRMGDLLEAMMEKYGKVDVKEIGLQPGENMHETIDGEQSSENAERYTKSEPNACYNREDSESVGSE